MKKVLYIYAGIDRKELEKKVEAGESPDTPFFGFRHLKKVSGIEASYLQLSKQTYSWGGAFFRRFALTRALYIGFKFYRLLALQDVIVVTSSAYFSLTLFRILRLLKGRFYLMNLDLNIRFKRLEGESLERKWLWMTVSAADKIICISRHQERYLLSLGMDPRKLAFIPMGVDKNFYQLMRTSREIILTVGRDVGRDFVTFLEAIGSLDDKAVMICSPHNMYGLEDKIPSNLSILYDQPYSVLKNYYGKAKLFVIATKPASALMGSDCPGQTSVLDTLAYGMPMVATESAWFDGYFESEKHLIIVPPSNSQELKDAIKQVSNDNELAERLSQEGRRLIEERCNSQAMGEAIAGILLGNS